MYLLVVTTCICILVTAVSDTLACTCLPGHPQDFFCRADFAIKGKVLSEQRLKPGDINSYVVYKVKVLKSFKGYLGKYLKIRTGGNSAMCGLGIDLSQGKKKPTWLLVGSMHDGQLDVNSCGLNYLWEDLKGKPMKKHLKKHSYFKNCDNCKVKTCTENPCVTDKSSCPWTAGSCTDRFCGVRGYYKKECRWNRKCDVTVKNIIPAAPSQE